MNRRQAITRFSASAALIGLGVPIAKAEQPIHEQIQAKMDELAELCEKALPAGATLTQINYVKMPGRAYFGVHADTANASLMLSPSKGQGWKNLR